MSAATVTAHGDAPVAVPGLGFAALRELRATRKRHRIGEMEWFDAAYKVYLVALGGGVGMLWLSDLVGDDELTVVQAANVSKHGPAILGMVAVLAFVLGLRGGSQGGPLALESADVTYVMLAPIDRRRALLKPAIQRIRSAAFVGMALGGVAGQLAGRRLPGTTSSWFLGGALFGMNIAFLWVGGALVAHALRLRLSIATVIALVGISWQTAAIARGIPGVADLDGSLGLWGWRQHPVDLIAVALSMLFVGLGIAGLARTSLDALARRASLVAQLRFAVTMQDLRTVVLLRRQLSYERTRRRPWIRLSSTGRGNPVWRRGWHSLLRFPVGRLIRMAALAIGAGACQVAAFRGTTPAILGTMILTFVLGLEVLEPLSQEIDQPDRTESYPVERSLLMVRLMIAPAVALVPFAIIAGATAAIIESVQSNDAGGAIVVAAILALPTLLAGAAGAAVSVVKDAPDPLASNKQETYMPPEMAGFGTVIRTLIPLVISIAGAVSVLLVRSSVDRDGPDAAIGAAVRAAIATLLVAVAVGTWTRYRDRIRRSISGFVSEGRTYTQQQRTPHAGGPSTPASGNTTTPASGPSTNRPPNRPSNRPPNRPRSPG